MTLTCAASPSGADLVLLVGRINCTNCLPDEHLRVNVTHKRSLRERPGRCTHAADEQRSSLVLTHTVAMRSVLGQRWQHVLAAECRAAQHGVRLSANTQR
jgi:hypothetical protein